MYFIKSNSKNNLLYESHNKAEFFKQFLYHFDIQLIILWEKKRD